MKDAILKLLELQKKDVVWLDAKAAADSAPKDIMRVEKRKAEISAAFDGKKRELSDLEARRAEMRITRRTLEEKTQKYKVQLASVKKQSDYDALNAEIDKMKKQSGEIEEEELNTMFEIDSKRIAINGEEAEKNAALKSCDEEIAELQTRKVFLEKEVVEAKKEADAFRPNVPPEFLETYMRLKEMGKIFPLVVRLNGDLCGGCHIKVYTSASEIEQSPVPVCCEHCGKILYA